MNVRLTLATLALGLLAGTAFAAAPAAPAPAGAAAPAAAAKAKPAAHRHHVRVARHTLKCKAPEMAVKGKCEAPKTAG
jgi:hypothetical protein